MKSVCAAFLLTSAPHGVAALFSCGCNPFSEQQTTSIAQQTVEELNVDLAMLCKDLGSF